MLGVYQTGPFIVQEAALLDGDGDGRGTQRPAPIDREGAAKRFFTLTAEGKGLE